jgi:alcohol dehydrogenase class IV
MVESAKDVDFSLSHGFCAKVKNREPEARKARARVMVKTSNSRSYHNGAADVRYTAPVQAPVGEFLMSRLERVIYGPGKIDALGADLERRGLSRALVVTTLAGFPILDTVTAALGARCAGVFTGIVQHVPRGTVDALQAEAERVNADCLVSFGGGSPIDSCKVAIFGLLAKRELIHIAVPTTLSAAEYTFAGGVTDESTRVKGGVYDPRVMPRTVIADPLLCVDTPDWLWVSTGMRALDHAIECAYAIRHQPISDALASKSIALLVEHLPASIRTKGEESVAHRGYCLTASWFSIFGAMNTRFGLSHLLGHQIGPRWNVPHGVTSCITLPHAMRFMADLAAERFGPIAEGFGIPFDPANPKRAALACADRTAEFIAQFDVPRTLKAAGVPHEEIGEIVDPITHELEKMGVTDRPLTRAEVLGLLEASYV